jgi:hypothetical protein
MTLCAKGLLLRERGGFFMRSAKTISGDPVQRPPLTLERRNNAAVQL